MILTAGRAIEPGEQVGFDYGEAYFELFNREELFFDSKTGYAYPKPMVCFPREIYNTLLQSLFQKNLVAVRDLLHAFHPDILPILKEFYRYTDSPYADSLQTLINESLNEVRTLNDDGITDKTISDLYGKYQHLSAWRALKSPEFGVIKVCLKENSLPVAIKNISNYYLGGSSSFFKVQAQEIADEFAAIQEIIEYKEVPQY